MPGANDVIAVVVFVLWVFVAKSMGQNILPAEADARARCTKMRTDYDIKPGKSFGSLPASQHNSYLRLKCYRFFCEPNAMAGKGVFDCVELKNQQHPDPQKTLGPVSVV